MNPIYVKCHNLYGNYSDAVVESKIHKSQLGPAN